MVWMPILPLCTRHGAVFGRMQGHDSVRVKARVAWDNVEGARLYAESHMTEARLPPPDERRVGQDTLVGMLVGRGEQVGILRTREDMQRNVVDRRGPVVMDEKVVQRSGGESRRERPRRWQVGAGRR